MSHYISCYNENKELEHFKVPGPVYVYIVQLENEIKYGSGGVKRRYAFRFGEKDELAHHLPQGGDFAL